MGQHEKTGPRKLPDILTHQEQKMLLAQPNPKAPTGLRNLCMLRVMLNAGLRLSEIIHLSPDDQDVDTGELVIRRSTGEPGRTLWLGEEDRALIARWQTIKPESEYLFCTLKGDILKDRYVREMVKRLGRKAGITKNIFPHTLRHTFAADLYAKTKDIRIVQKALGHVDLSTTMIYTYIIDEELEGALSTFIKGRHFSEPEEERAAEAPPQEQTTTAKAEQEMEEAQTRKYAMHAMKCICGDIIGRGMEKCSGCGRSIEEILEKLKRNFHRVNFGMQEAQGESESLS